MIRLNKGEINTQAHTYSNYIQKLQHHNHSVEQNDAIIHQVDLCCRPVMHREQVVHNNHELTLEWTGVFQFILCYARQSRTNKYIITEW